MKRKYIPLLLFFLMQSITVIFAQHLFFDNYTDDGSYKNTIPQEEELLTLLANMSPAEQKFYNKTITEICKKILLEQAALKKPETQDKLWFKKRRILLGALVVITISFSVFLYYKLPPLIEKIKEICAQPALSKTIAEQNVLQQQTIEQLSLKQQELIAQQISDKEQLTSLQQRLTEQQNLLSQTQEQASIDQQHSHTKQQAAITQLQEAIETLQKQTETQATASCLKLEDTITNLRNQCTAKQQELLSQLIDDREQLTTLNQQLTEQKNLFAQAQEQASIDQQRSHTNQQAAITQLQETITALQKQTETQAIASCLKLEEALANLSNQCTTKQQELLSQLVADREQSANLNQQLTEQKNLFTQAQQETRQQLASHSKSGQQIAATQTKLIGLMSKQELLQENLRQTQMHQEPVFRKVEPELTKMDYKIDAQKIALDQLTADYKEEAHKTQEYIKQLKDTYADRIQACRDNVNRQARLLEDWIVQMSRLADAAAIPTPALSFCDFIMGVFSWDNVNQAAQTTENISRAVTSVSNVISPPAQSTTALTRTSNHPLDRLLPSPPTAYPSSR